ncbi:sushi, von Willebrand factor type A, EGF and pentraxin domain-containing protein 1 isoform X2 [Gadus chalcogrammus]|uniref:sushi, von Willebrand factor type A, EGF and pentraxin domain-containing protein 1 isoform X2 n=1 Tax=Gadus chalcogrammus TaxID=1042646 RepID=UPI0024C2A337|nr:sushi, von Willebrand factor type A, EGF and pentraxin domain-containing protein 1 isoform X2 [Gadus chalcogrammus]
MDRGHVIWIVLLSVIPAGRPAGDICASCHANATCSFLPDGSGRVCICMYGFIGNGRTLCQDKDECQIGARNICGPRAACHNTVGSYTCTCMGGFRPSNHRTSFTPNDGTYCQDIDECGRHPAVCGEGAHCVNLEGDFECRCLLGYRAHNASDPFQPLRDKGSCKVVDCGPPPAGEAVRVLSTNGTAYGSVVLMGCKDGFLWRRGDNSSTCGPDGTWSRPAPLCQGRPAGDICASCHANATCSILPDGSGRVCICMYGFIGNGRTLCQDKDECQIGARKICGPRASCQNTVGSYTCTCMGGFRPSNHRTSFTPNDGTYCQDIDECGRHPAVCGEGAHCVNLEGDFECRCLLGYRAHNASDPFQPLRDKGSCKLVDCGPPPAGEAVRVLSTNGTAYGSVVLMGCKDGFLWRRGDNSSTCGPDGTWSRPAPLCQDIDECGRHPAVCGEGARCVNLEGDFECRCLLGYRAHNASDPFQPLRDKGSCKVVDCGPPPAGEAVRVLSTNGTAYGSVVLMGCKDGFLWRRGDNSSTCGPDGTWSRPAPLCQEIQCGEPLSKPHARMLWDNGTRVGSVLHYQCEEGYRPSTNRHSPSTNRSVCGEDGQWEESDLRCEARCRLTPSLAHAEVAWYNSSVTVHRCVDGYRSSRGSSVSVCGNAGQWQKATLKCIEIQCGEPLSKPHARMLWDNGTRVGSVLHYQCEEGYRPSTNRHSPSTNRSVCGEDGQWEESDLRCEARCGPAPSLANAEVAWYNSSVTVHRCVDGYRSSRGISVSVCGNAGQWQKATLKCTEVKPAVNDLRVFNEKCLQWRAEKNDVDKEIYKVVFRGTRDYQGAFRHEKRQLLHSWDKWVDVCLSLLPATNYTISVIALSTRFTANITTSTSLQVPQAPLVLYRELDAPPATLRLRRSAHTLDAISVYQVVVVPLDGTVVFDCRSRGIPGSAQGVPPSSQYITGQFPLGHMNDTEMIFTVGDGRFHGGFLNAPLKRGTSYYVILRVVSQWKEAFNSSCVLWAKVTGTSYVMRVSSLLAACSVGGLLLVVLLVYIYIGFFKRRESRLNSQ